jgi:3-oxoacyl-[acyl-carrier protein] reductase
MPDRYQQLTSSPIGQQVASTLGLPVPVRLRRYEPGAPVIRGPVLVGAAPGGRTSEQIRTVLETLEADVKTEPTGDGSNGQRYAALVFDATGIRESAGLRALYDFFHPVIRHVGASGRVVLVGGSPEDADDPREVTAQRSIEGFVRSVAKEMKRGATVNLVQVADDAEDGLESTLRFFLSGRSAFVNGQPVRIAPTNESPVDSLDWDRPLDGQVAVVTGAAQGIGEKIAEVLARDGAHVVCLDIPAQGDRLADVANRIGGSSMQLDISADDAPDVLVEQLGERHDGVDVVVHNAGITRDKTLAGMSEDRWDAVLAVNLTAQERINEALLSDDVLNDHGRIVCVSSVSGIAGNRGQTNYAASKAGIIGMVSALAPRLAERSGTINAVAPGFIETAMTDEMPLPVREAGRRMNSLNQGGQPVDVAETIAWLANPATAWVNGEVVRVCGQSLIGA